MSSTYYLGPLAGNVWNQYSNPVGQVYYFNTVSQQTTYTIPAGWEDVAAVSDHAISYCTS